MGNSHKENWSKQIVFFLALLAQVMCQDVWSETNNSSSNSARQKKVLNIFSVVRFPNTNCAGASYNGTCYSATECSNLGGTSSGTCAAGYGVCCIFTLSCGGTSSQNCTYFISTGSEVGQCAVKICPCSGNICQLRLDFTSFVINQPVTATGTVGILTGSNGVQVTAASQCQTDQFTVSSPSGTAPPMICGTNSGSHMYVDSSTLCNTLYFNLMAGVTTVTRSWNIKVTQYSCDYNNLAPKGCTQYYWGSTTGTVNSYNYNSGSGRQLANQNQNICVRQERSYCQVCWTTVIATTDFSVSTGGSSVKTGSGCCGYGIAGTGKVAVGYDCVLVPGPLNTAGVSKTALYNGICGGRFGTAAGMAGSTTVCSKKTPFNLQFISDNFEFAAEAAARNAGFKLVYTLKSC